MNDETKMMKASHEFEVSRIKTQLLSDVTTKITEKYDYVSFRDIEEIATKARFLVALVFGESDKEKGGEE